MRIDDPFIFGKYRGKTPRELIRNNKGWYLVWCLNNIKGFYLEPSQFEDAVKLKYSRQYNYLFKQRRA